MNEFDSDVMRVVRGAGRLHAQAAPRNEGSGQTQRRLNRVSAAVDRHGVQCHVLKFHVFKQPMSRKTHAQDGLMRRGWM